MVRGGRVVVRGGGGDRGRGGGGDAVVRCAARSNGDACVVRLPYPACMESSIIAELAEWEPTVSPAETGDPLWKLHAYRLSRYQLHCCLTDIRQVQPPLNRDGAEQLRRSVASICANLSEGYSRRTPVDRARFYSYALGSLREAAVWYLSLSSILPTTTLAHRLGLIAQERRLVLGVLKSVSKGMGSPGGQ